MLQRDHTAKQHQSGPPTNLETNKFLTVNRKFKSVNKQLFLKENLLVSTRPTTTAV